MILNRLLLAFVFVWVAGVAILTFGELWYRVSTAPSFWEGWTRFTDFSGPFDVKYYLSRVILLIPAVAAHIWREHRMGRES